MPFDIRKNKLPSSRGRNAQKSNQTEPKISVNAAITTRRGENKTRKTSWKMERSFLFSFKSWKASLDEKNEKRQKCNAFLGTRTELN